MARIFISYSRADRQFVDALVPLLRQMYGNDSLWFDDDIHGGADWWQLILDQIADCDLFVYLISNDSLASPYCQSELREALRLHKQFLPVIIRPKTQYPGNVDDDLKQILRRTQHVDMSAGFKNPKITTNLYRSISFELDRVTTPAPPPHYAQPVSQPPVPDKKRGRFKLNEPWAIIIAAVIGGIFVIVAALIGSGILGGNDATPTLKQAAVASDPLPTNTPTLTDTPEPFIPPETQVPMDLTNTAAARPTHTPLPTFTPTNTPDYNATYDAEATRIIATEIASWTETPTYTPSHTPTPSPIPAESHNDAWTPVVQEFNGLPFVQVPAGCFMMGSEDGYSNEKPVHEVCLSEFWIGQTEVTNAQYRNCVEAGACTPPGKRTYYDDLAYADHPVMYVDWEQASAYAEWIGGTLPTEAQWEYAARGPEGWIYPWGDTNPTCDQANIYDCEGDTAPVGPEQRPGGASWVGALDMSGNVWEWTADWYAEDYYVTLDAGAQDPTGPVGGFSRVVRGGSWLDVRGYARVVSRSSYPPYSRSITDGFRVVCASPFSINH